MLLAFGKATMVLSVLTLGGTLGGSLLRNTPHHELHLRDTPQQILMIRVSQETSPGAGDFDQNILGFTKALQTTGTAADFYEYHRNSDNYGNADPVLTANTSQIFFVNAGDGLALFVVHNNSNHPENGSGGAARTRWELSGGRADVLLTDDDSESWAIHEGTVFINSCWWAQSNTDGMVVGALPVGFTILGQFLQPPTNLGGGWVVLSADGSKLPLQLVPGQRVRLDVKLHVKVRQDH